MPSGHRRFTYCQGLDGVYRVQITRLESLEVSEQIIAPSTVELEKAGNIQYELTELRAEEKGLAISMVAKHPGMVASANNDDDEFDDNDVKPSLPSIRNDPSTDCDDFTMTNVDSMDGGGPAAPELEIIKQTMLKQSHTDDEQMSDADCESGTLKSINDFSVMKKYIQNDRKPNKIVITVEELDSDGNIVKTETQQVTEYSLC